MICPSCDGSGRVFAFIDWRDDDSPTGMSGGCGMIQCSTCDGSGEVDDEFARRCEEGRKMRKERVARGESLRQAADRMGISAAKLSKIEHGGKP